MRELMRSIAVIVTAAFRTDWKMALGALAEPIGQATYPLFGLWVALVVDGVVESRTALIWTGVAGIAATQAVSFLVQLYAAGLRISLSELVGHAFDREIATLTAQLPGLEHQENPEYRDRLELLRQTQGLLGQSLNALINALNGVVGAIVVLTLLAIASPILLGLIVFALPSFWTARQYQRRIGTAEKRTAPLVRLARQFQELAVDPAAGAELRVSGLQETILERHQTAWCAAQRPILRVERRKALVSIGEQVLFVAGFTLAVGVMMWLAYHGQATAGKVLLVAVVGTQVQERVFTPIYAMADLGPALRAAARIRWLRDYAATAQTRTGGVKALPETLVDGLVLENVTFSYPGKSEPALYDLSARLPAGSVIAVVGENGMGKSSLIKLLCRFYEPTAGRVTLDGTDLSGFDLGEWRSRISAGFQDFARPEFLVREVVGLGDLEAMEAESGVAKAIRLAGAEEVVQQLPHRLDTQLGSTWEGGVNLSVGQWQKLALARALMREYPLLVVLDEPTASLDAQTESAIFERFAETARSGRTRGAITVLVSHRFSTVRTADLILVLDSGRLVEQGSHAELMARDGRYAALYRLQATSYR
jgi:ATP-binding cassette subfamily B protein